MIKIQPPKFKTFQNNQKNVSSFNSMHQNHKFIINPSNFSISASKFRLSSTKRSVITIKCTQSDNSPLRRPSIASPPVKPSPPSQPPSPPAAAGQNAVTMEFQRQKAKEIQQYFKQKILEESNQ